MQRLRLAGTYGKERLELACERALAAGVASSRYVERLPQGRPAAPFSPMPTPRTPIEAITRPRRAAIAALRCGFYSEDVEPSMHQPVRHGIEVAVDGDVIVDVDPRHEPLADDKRRRR